MSFLEMFAKGGEFKASEYPEFFGTMIECQKLCRKYNLLDVDDMNTQNQMIKQMFGKTGKQFFVMQPFQCGFGKNIEIGNNFFMNSNCTILDAAKVTFGDNIWIGPNCAFYTSGHCPNPKKRIEGWTYAYPITVENNVYFGGNVLVVASKEGGITIGENSVIAAGSVVTKDVPANVLVAGNPAKIIHNL